MKTLEEIRDLILPSITHSKVCFVCHNAGSADELCEVGKDIQFDVYKQLDAIGY